MVLIDTTIWSLALRRRRKQLSGEESRLVDDWMRLVETGQAALIGAIRQEVLSGIRSGEMFERVRSEITDVRFIRYLIVDIPDHDRAAQFYNVCQTRGVAASSVDMLICAVAHREEIELFTTDGDFTHYSKHLPIRLYRPTGI